MAQSLTETARQTASFHHSTRSYQVDAGKGRLTLSDGSYFEGTFERDEVGNVGFCTEQRSS